MSFLDKETDYNTGTQTTQRIMSPAPSMNSRNSLELQMAGVLSVDQAKQQTEKILKTFWNERLSFSVQTAWDNLDLDPTDVITLRFGSLTVDVRVTSLDWADGLTVQLEASAQMPGQYVSVSSGISREGLNEQTIATPVFVDLVILDIPLLRDIDEPDGLSHLVIHYIGLPNRQTFRKAVVYQEQQWSGYEQIDVLSKYPSWGILLTQLWDPTPGMEFTTDHRRSIEVQMILGGDELESVTYQKMLAGANGALILRTNGDVEAIQYQTISQIGPGRYRLSSILRCRRGTDTMAYGYTGGERIVFLDPRNLNTMPVSLKNLNQSQRFKGVNVGEFIEEVNPQEITLRGNSMKPHHPHRIRAERAGDDLVISWLRRDRFGGDRDDSWENPIFNDSEIYDLDIFDEPGGLLLRTVTGITSRNWVYSEADQVSDGHMTPMKTVTIKLYRVSLQVGRGFSREVTLSVT